MKSDADMAGNVAIDLAGDVAGDVSSTAHEWMGPIQSGPPSWALFQPNINYQLTKFPIQNSH